MVWFNEQIHSEIHSKKIFIKIADFCPITPKIAKMGKSRRFATVGFSAFGAINFADSAVRYRKKVLISQCYLYNVCVMITFITCLVVLVVAYFLYGGLMSRIAGIDP